MAKDLFFCILSAILVILSFPRSDYWILAWLAFVPLFFVLENKSKLKRFIYSYFTGVIFWAGTIYWLIHITLPGTIVLILYLALYFGVFGLTYNLRLKTYDFLVIPSLWVLLEYTRSHLLTGFSWVLLGYSQYKNLPIIQISDITGVWGVSFLVMMVNVVIYSALRKKQKYLLTLVLLVIVLIYGFYRIHEQRVASSEPRIKISVIQGNIPQELKWDPEAAAFIVEKYSGLTKEAALNKPDLIIWPEASSPLVLGEDHLIFKDIFSLARETKIPLLIGTVTREKEEYFNSALLIGSLGKPSGRYDKMHLVPFGEYIPLKKLLPFLQTVVPIGDIAFGNEYTVFTSHGINFSVLICFEDLFPELSRGFVKNGANFLVNITNDAWYKKTSAAYQHFQASVFRAVENRTFLVRSANTGISGFIHPTGRIISLINDKEGKEIFVDGFDTQEIANRKGDFTLYTKYGDFFPVACFLLILCVIIARFFRA